VLGSLGLLKYANIVINKNAQKKKCFFVQGESPNLSAMSEDPFSWNVQYPRALLMVKHEAERYVALQK